MPGRVAVVTDSTALLPVGTAREHAIEVVRLQVVVDGVAHADGDVDGDLVAASLRSGRGVTTSRPSPDAFARTYLSLGSRGVRDVVSVHLSGQMSGTVDAARLAARDVVGSGVAVEVVDSASLGMGLGFAVLAAARAAAAGGTALQVAGAARRRAAATAILCCVDSLEHLRRGGRIGAAQAWLGSALTIKPVLRLRDGRLEPMERVRTSRRALAAMVDAAAGHAGESPAACVDVAVHHLDARRRAQEVAEQLPVRISGLREVVVGDVGPVIGAHVGPGAVAVVVAPVLPG